ncbi:uncharacterized protein LOC111870214 isoform X2 [Cryptotermes secundus]|uniref:uncharacterized protein LOC111870214 isoform X2 n=1 Tax=Cryptotermes secundus TaxID=105785 RepID=UPI001454D7A1|nr:uncharacterized protein LOC111870214 isoform X2 [Cryptotermes secundus]
MRLKQVKTVATVADCYERVAIGQRLKSSDVLRSTVSQRVKNCEEECDLDLDKCSSFDFGISQQGNGTCNLSPKIPPRSGTLVEDPDYDVYVKKQECRYVRPPPLSYPTLTKPKETCFRRLLTGKRVAEQHIRRSLPSQTADLCREECSTEKHFVCEGFNYRVDVGGFGRGSCELTDVPSTRLDLGRDFFPDREYDFYERDRNDGPDCNVPLGGGLYGDSNAYEHYYGSGGNTDRYNSWDGGRRPSYGGGRWDNYGGSSSHGPWGSYGSVNYGGGGGGQNYGPWFSYGSGGGSHGGGVGFYGGSGGGGNGWYGTGRPPSDWQNSGGGRRGWYWSRPSGGWNGNKEVGFHGYGSAPPFGYHEECFLRSRTGFRLDRRILKVAITVPSLHDCEIECAKEGHFICNSFSFRYSLEPSFPHENCHLSDRIYYDLDPYTDILPDRNYDVYSRNEYARTCQEKFPQRRPYVESECFVRVRSGQSLDHSVVKDRLNVHSVGECELECLRSRYFTCRGFSYRYGPPISAPPENCLLSDWPFFELDPRRQLVDDLGYELYERGSYGHGCEINHYSPYPEEQYEFQHQHHYHEGGGSGRHPPSRPPPRPPAYPKPSDEQCYVVYGGPARLLPIVVRSSLDVPTELDCKAECTRARESFNFFCTALSFRSRNVYHPNPRYDENVPEHNCLLSDIEQRDLRPGLDYIHDSNNWMFAWNFLDQRCDLIAHNPEQQHRFDGHYIPGRVDVQTWQRFTVSGRPCRYGTECIENREAGFWYCELEGGDAGAWDYCCRPGHQCGYSEGYSYPWCYVGSAARDQWRPCSDHYYPYSHDPHGGPQRPPHGQHHIEAFHYEMYGPPRYWPVAYLHKDAPPNSTTLILPPGNKDSGSLLSGYGSHINGGIENHVDSNRYNYGKKLTWLTPDNNTGSHTATVTKIDIDKSKDQNMKDKMDPLFVLVNEYDSSGTETKKDHKLTGMPEADMKTTTNAPTGVTKLQPRFVTLREQDHKLSKLVARDTVPGEIKHWSWKGNKNEEEEVMSKVIPTPVEFRRKMSQQSSNGDAGNVTVKTVQFQLAVPRGTVTKL